MSDEQFDKLISLLEKMINVEYTLTGAADWPLLVALAVILASSIGAIIALLVYIHQDLKSTIKEKNTDLVGHIEQEVEDRKESIQQCYDNWRTEKGDLWTAIEKCQSDCCPRGG